MGLFGLFGEKKTPAQKEYEKVYNKFPSKKIGVKDMEAAVAAWEGADGPQEAVWKAYFKIALAYDCGEFVAMDEEAAKPYHEKVRSMIQTSGDQKLRTWCNDFYYWYNQCAINHYKKLDQQTLNIRRLGNAAMNVMGISGDARMSKEICEVLYNVYMNESGETGKTAQAFYYYMNECKTDKNGDLVDCNGDPKYRDEFSVKTVKKFEEREYKEYKQMTKVFDKKITYGDMDTDYHNYIYGFQFFNHSPLCAMYAFDNIGNPVIYGLERVFRAAYMGNSMAIHKLALLANASKDDHEIVAAAFNSKYRSLDAFLLSSLQSCEKAGDHTAAELIARYYTE